MSSSISLEEFANAIEEIVLDFQEDVLDVITEQTRESGRELRDLVREGAPVRKEAYPKSYKRTPGSYKKAIRVTNTTDIFGVAGAVVHVRSPHYRLAHLLERPHALRNGGMSRSFPHFKPARDKIEVSYVRDLTRKLEGI